MKWQIPSDCTLTTRKISSANLLVDSIEYSLTTAMLSTGVRCQVSFLIDDANLVGGTGVLEQRMFDAIRRIEAATSV